MLTVHFHCFLLPSCSLLFSAVNLVFQDNQTTNWKMTQNLGDMFTQRAKVKSCLFALVWKVKVLPNSTFYCCKVLPDQVLYFAGLV